jgi:hypothetical protein
MATAVDPAIADQFEDLVRIYPDAEVTPVPGGLGLVSVPNIPLGNGWNQQMTTVHFLIPNGYPTARPDCFWADAELRTANGDMPANAAQNPIPGRAGPHVWFSWHLASWQPARDSLITYLRVIRERLAQAR